MNCRTYPAFNKFTNYGNAERPISLRGFNFFGSFILKVSTFYSGKKTEKFFTDKENENYFISLVDENESMRKAFNNYANS